MKLFGRFSRQIISHSHLWLFIIVAGAYLPSTRGGFIYDDRIVLLEQKAPHSSADFSRIFAERHFPTLPYYRPLTRLTLLAQKSLHGDDPAPFHLFNALLMGLTAVAAHALLRYAPFLVPAGPAFILAGLFALHPAASSTVYPISSGRETLLPAFLIIITIICRMKAGQRYRLLTLLLFILALFSKEQAVMLLPLLLLADWLGLSSDPPGKRLGKWATRYLPFMLVLTFYISIRYALFGGEEFKIVVFDQPLHPLLSLLFFLQTSFAPFVRLVYEPPFEVWFSPIRLACAVFVIVLLGIAAVGIRRLAGRQIFFWTSWILLLQLPTAHILRQEAPFDERYVFLSMLGLAGIIGAVFVHRFPGSRPTLILAAFGIACLLGFIIIGAWRGGDFRQDDRFIRRWLETNPSSYVARNLYGRLLLRQGKPAEAASHFEAAAVIDPSGPYHLLNLGLAYEGLGKIREAAEVLRQAVEQQPGNPLIHYNMGNIMVEAGNPDEAERHFREAVRLNPSYISALNNLGRVLEDQERLEEAIVVYRRALEQAPDDFLLRANLDRALAGTALNANPLPRTRERGFEEKPPKKRGCQ